MTDVKPSIYSNPELATWLGSFEGVPDDWGRTKVKPVSSTALTMGGRLNGAFGRLGVLLPGFALAFMIAFAGKWVSHWLGVDLLHFDKSPISSIMLAIVLGLIIGNVVGLPEVYKPGLTWCVKKILRVGIALLGIRMSLLAAGKIGLVALPVVFGCIAAALILVTRINRAMGLPRRLGSLIAVGTSICGVSAIVATAPTIDAEDDEISYAVATITLFGMVAMFTYPFLASWLFAGNPHMAGLFLGTAIHDTSQVAGAGLMYQQQFDAPAALDTAVVTKLIRNLFMVGVIPLLAILYHRGKSDGVAQPRWYKMVPLFVLGFVAMTLVRTVGDMGASGGSGHAYGLFGAETWHHLIGQTKGLAKWCLMFAMAAVGLGTSLKRIMKMGLRPFAVGFAAAGLVGVVSFVLTRWFGPMI